MDAEEVAIIERIRQTDSLSPIVKQSRISEVKKTFSSSRQSSAKTIFNVVNSMVGSGTLVMPLYFLKTGLVTAILVLVLVGAVEYSTGICYLKNFSQSEDSTVPSQVDRILGKKWKKTYIFSAVIELFTCMFAYFLLLANILYTLLQTFFELPDKDHITFGSFSYQWIGIILAVICFALCSIKEIKWVLLFNVAGVYIISAYMLFLFFIGIDSIISGKVTFDVANGGIRLFSGDIFTILGIYALAYSVHPYIVDIFKHNSEQTKNVRDFGLSYVMGTVIYVGVGLFGAFGVFWRPGCSESSNTVLDCLKENTGVIRYFSAGIELLLFLQILSVVPLVCFCTRSQLFSLFYEEHEKIAPWKMVAFNVAFGVGGLSIQIPNVQPGMAMSFCGAVCAFVFLYLIPIKLHMKAKGKAIAPRDESPLETQINRLGAINTSDSPTVLLLSDTESSKNGGEGKSQVWWYAFWYAIMFYGVFVMVSILVDIILKLFK